MGSTAEVLVFGGAPDAFDEVARRLEELEQSWSRFRPSSDLSRLNDAEAERVEVSPLLLEALTRAQVGWAMTDGWFDPTVHDALVGAGYADSFSTTARDRGDLRRCRPAPGLGDVEIDVDRCVVSRPRGLRFDLGGIGKGLAGDIVAVELIAAGADGVCVALGGDVRVAGTSPAGGWSIPVEEPTVADAERVGPSWFDARLAEGAIVTSTTRFRRWTTTSGEHAHHVIDPFTGRPSTSGLETAVVAASEAWWAEVLAKSALVAGPLVGPRLLERHGVTGWLVPA